MKPPDQSVRQGRNSLFEDEDMKNLIAFVTSLATSQGAMAATHYMSAANAFGLKNMQYALEENASDNVIYSPISAHLALNMLLNGAASKTANEIAKTLNLTPGALAASNGEMMKRMEDLNSRPNGELKLTLANGMWTKPDLKVKPAYETAMQKYFQAEVAPLNSPAQINKWAADKTNNLITNVIDDIGGLEMFLANVTYFKADWTMPYGKAYDGTFSSLGATTPEKAQMMSGKKYIRYLKTVNAEVVDLPYGNQKLASMIIILPVKDVDFAGFRKQADPNYVESLIADLEKAAEQRVFVTIPKVNAKTTFEMKGSLSAMGMPTVFTNAADLSGISEEPLKLSRVKQEAVIKIDENGTDAAAVTSIGPETASARRPLISFEADHPFLYFIRDNKSGVILFAGQIVKP